jgi:hypothetical protein
MGNEIAVYWTPYCTQVYGLESGGEIITIQKNDSRFIRELRKLKPMAAYPVNSRGEESPEIEWVSGCGGLKVSADKADMVKMLINSL